MQLLLHLGVLATKRSGLRTHLFNAIIQIVQSGNLRLIRILNNRGKLLSAV